MAKVLSASDLDVFRHSHSGSSELWDFGRAVGDKIPGYKISATFLTTLRANLVLTSALDTPTTSAMSTPLSTPINPPLPAPTSSPLSNPAITSSNAPNLHTDSNPPSPEDSLPELTTYTAIDATEKEDALRLIADSIAQMRQVASYEIITHPLSLALVTVALGIITNFMPHTSVSDLSLLATTWAGTIMATLLGVRIITGGFIEQAEKIGWAWMEDSRTQSWGSDGSESGEKTGRAKRKEDCVVVVTKWGEKMIAAVVMRVVKKERRAWVRAWTVERRYRRRGVGRGIMEEAVRYCVVDKGVRGVEVEEGTYSVQSLPQIFQTPFNRREEKAIRVLEDVVAKQARKKS